MLILPASKRLTHELLGDSLVKLRFCPEESAGALPLHGCADWLLSFPFLLRSVNRSYQVGPFEGGPGRGEGEGTFSILKPILKISADCSNLHRFLPLPAKPSTQKAQTLKLNPHLERGAVQQCTENCPDRHHRLLTVPAQVPQVLQRWSTGHPEAASVFLETSFL